MAGIEMRYKPGSGFFVNVPARDLSAEEVERYGREFLLALGLYEEVNPPKPNKAKETIESDIEPIEADEQTEEDEQWQE
jgi:hypothetical protein